MNIKKILKLALIIIIFLSSITVVSLSDVEQNRKEVHVLMISSYSPSFMTFFQQIDGVKSQLVDKNIILDIEFMDSKRYYTEENLENFYNSLVYKLSRINYDAVIVSDDNALNFVMEHKDELFHEMPIVFMGINNLDNAFEANQDPFITGVVEASSIDKTIEIALELNPDAKNIVAITDLTNSGQGDLKRFYDLENIFSAYEMKDIDLSQYTFDEFKNQLNMLNKQDVIILLSVYSDKDNNRISFYEGLEYVVNNTSQPVYHPYLHGIGEGILGGKVISHYNQGQTAGAIVLRILGGEQVSEIQYIQDSPNQYTFDYKVMEKYNIKMSALPKDSIVINYQESIFEKYWQYILGAIAVIAFQGFIIMLLSKTIKMKKIVELELIENHKALKLSNEEVKLLNNNLEKRVEERTFQLEEVNEELRMALSNLKFTQDRLLITEAMESFLKLSRKLAHLINTPLGTALTSASYQNNLVDQMENNVCENIRINKSDISKIRASNNMMLSNLSVAIKIVEELQAYTTFEPSRLIDLAQSIKNFIDFELKDPIYNDVNIVLDLDSEIELLIQEKMLHKILKSLIENAMDFSEVNDLMIKITLKREQRDCVIAVEDNGSGIPKELQNDIFNPFFSTTPHKLGMGLFLAENTIYQTMNGRFLLDTDFHTGARFVIRLTNRNNNSNL